MSFWAAHYLNTRCTGGSPNTLDAKARDLAGFIRWFVATNGIDTLRAWRVRDTQPPPTCASLLRKTPCKKIERADIARPL